MEYAGQQPPQRHSVPPPRPPPPVASSAQRGDVAQEASGSFQAFQKLHDKTYALVQKGLIADENGNKTAALEHYTRSLTLLDEILAVDCEALIAASSEEKDSAKQMQQKMYKTKLQISYRVSSIKDSGEQLAYPDTSLDSEQGAGVRLPSYEEAVSSSESSLISDAALGDSIMSAEYPTSQRAQSAQGTELFSIPDGVQIFYITREGYVSAPSYPTALHVVMFEEAIEGNTQSHQIQDAPPAFIQVGEWLYPLIPGTSPVLHATFGAYLFPDVSAEGLGSSVGLMLPETVSQQEKVAFEEILRNFSAVQEQQSQIEPEDLVITSASATVAIVSETIPKVSEDEQNRQSVQDQSTAGKISRGILFASKWISWGVGKGAEKASELIAYGSKKLRDKLQQEYEPRQIDPRVQKGMVYARKATHVAVSVSSFIVSKLGEATVALGQQVAPHIRKKGEELMPKSLKTNSNRSKMDGAFKVVASGLQGFGTVYMSLEGAAKALARSLANETVVTVNHRYGEHAGKLTEDTVYSVGNIAMTAYNVDHLGIKAIAKRAAKDTGKAMLQDINEKKMQKNEPVAGANFGGSGGISQDRENNGEKPPL